MSLKFAIEIDWENLDSGPAEERAAFGAIGIRVDGAWLTEAHDAFVNRIRQKVHLSGYQLAQWLAWNWWRLRWEPGKRTLDWAMAHRMTTIGGGYVWPNINCVSDGEHFSLQARPVPSRAAEPLRYVAEVNASFSASEFESGVDSFIDQTVEQLRTEGIRDSNLQCIWADVREERLDCESAWYRRLEASMGFDPDDGHEQMVDALIADIGSLGKNAVSELAANASQEHPAPTTNNLRALAKRWGHDANLANSPRLPAEATVELRTGDPAWAVGKAIAHALRNHEKLGHGPLSNKRLAELAATLPTTLRPDDATLPFSFMLNGEGSKFIVVLHSPITTSRRFALARLIGDRLVNEVSEPLIPALRSNTYRQKLQRAFAAELLCPFEQAKQLLDEDLSEESQERVAARYEVSPMLVRTQLVNKDLLGRHALDPF